MGGMLLSFAKRSLATGALVCVPGVLAGQTYKSPAPKIEIVQLSVTGVKSVNQGDLVQSLAIEQSRCWSLVLVPICWVDKSSTFYQRAYLDHAELARTLFGRACSIFSVGIGGATVDTVIQPAGNHAVKVTLAVHEGAPTLVSSVQVVQKETVLTRHDLRGQVKVRVGAPLNLFDLDSSRAQLRSRLWDKGYSDAVVDTVTVIDTTGNSAAITMTITPRWVARVGTITVQGNQQVTTPTIMKSLSLHPGDIYKRSDVLESQRALYQSNLFRRASITVPRQRGQQDSVKQVTVAVQEAPPRTTQVSAGFNTVDFAQVEGRYTDYDWYGGARQLNLLLTVGNLFSRQLNGNGIFYDVSQTVVGAGAGQYFLPSYDASGEIRQPWFRSPDNDIAWSLFTHRRIAPGIYVDRGYGTSATFTRRFGTHTTASLSYRFEVTNVDAGDVYFCVSSGVCDAPTLAALQKNQTLSPLSISLATDKTDDPYEPRSGYRTQVDVENASAYTFSDFRYNRITNEESGFIPIGKRSVLAGHLQLGYVSALASTAAALGADSLSSADQNILHPRKRFYLGGAASVRGFAENQLGPRVLTIDPGVLRGSAANSSANACRATTPISQCNPNVAYISDQDFQPRALGGNQLLEASAEYRFPVVGNFMGAVFLDAGYLGQNTDTTLARHQAAVTPGFGVRYLSPAGPIRVDVGINPITTEQLPVVTEDFVDGHTTLVTLQERRTYHPVTGFLSRLMLHLAIGEAY